MTALLRLESRRGLLWEGGSGGLRDSVLLWFRPLWFFSRMGVRQSLLVSRWCLFFYLFWQFLVDAPDMTGRRDSLTSHQNALTQWPRCLPDRLRNSTLSLLFLENALIRLFSVQAKHHQQSQPLYLSGEDIHALSSVARSPGLTTTLLPMSTGASPRDIPVVDDPLPHTASSLFNYGSMYPRKSRIRPSTMIPATPRMAGRMMAGTLLTGIGLTLSVRFGNED